MGLLFWDASLSDVGLWRKCRRLVEMIEWWVVGEVEREEILTLLLVEVEVKGL